MKIETIEEVLNYISSGIVNNNKQDHYKVYMKMIYKFLIDSEKVNTEYLFALLKQTDHIILNLFKHKNEELKGDYFKF